MRSCWKLPFAFRKFNRNNLINKNFDEVFDPRIDFLRNGLIPKTLVGKQVPIHNGKFCRWIVVNRGMVGHKFGEFAVTKVLGSEFREAFRKRKKKKKKK